MGAGEALVGDEDQVIGKFARKMPFYGPKLLAKYVRNLGGGLYRDCQPASVRQNDQEVDMVASFLPRCIDERYFKWLLDQISKIRTGWTAC